MSLRRMRTIPDALAEVLALDKHSAITPYCVRMLCKNKRVRCIYTGRKILVDLDDLIDFLNNAGFEDISHSREELSENSQENAD